MVELAPADLGQELLDLAGGRVAGSAALRAATQTWRGPISPKCRCGDRREVASTPGMSRWRS
jgi:hypothetical protein